MTRNLYRQGDLLFMVIPRLPVDLTERAGKVIVQGEVTDHSHCLREGHVLSDVQGALFLEVVHATEVIHQEHHAIELSAGCYQVSRQREYTPQVIQEVRD